MMLWLPIAVCVGCIAGTYLAWHLRLQRTLLDWLIRKGKLAGITRPEVSYQHGLRDSEKLVSAVREALRYSDRRLATQRHGFRQAMEQLARVKKASEARKFARAWLEGEDAANRNDIAG